MEWITVDFHYSQLGYRDRPALQILKTPPVIDVELNAFKKR